MEVEAKQAEVLESFCLLAKGARGRACTQLITEATSHPGLFAFGELLDAPSISELEGTEHAPHLQLLRLFAHGTWGNYKALSSELPPLLPAQTLKLKQLTVVSLADHSKVLSYDLLMRELDVSSIRDLEDLLINDCMYVGILRGKLDQRSRVRTSEELMQSIRGQISWAAETTQAGAKHKATVEAVAEEVRKSLKAEQDMKNQPDGFGDGAASMDYVEEERPGRPKRRR
eukprot:jgi/Chlat1/8004/Chrsp7S07756